MRRDFLKNLGIEDKEIIDKILDENSSDIGKAKGEVDNLKSEISDLKKDVSDRDSKISELEKSVGDVDKLNTKINELETSNGDYVNQLKTLKKDHAIENGLRDAKAKNIKAVMALLDVDKIEFGDDGLTGLDEQIETLTKGDNTSFLFGESTKPPAGTNPSDPPGGNEGGNPPSGKSLTEAIASALGASK